MKKTKMLKVVIVGLALLIPLSTISCGARGGDGSKVNSTNNLAPSIASQENRRAFESYKLSNDIELSTDPKAPNLVEIFADGIDPLWTQAILGDKNTTDTKLKAFDPQIGTYHEFGKENGVELHTSFKDFVSFPNFFTGFSATLFGKSTELGGRNFSIPAMVDGLKNVDRSEDFEVDSWRTGAESEAMRAHFLTAKDAFSSATVFNEVDTMRPYDTIIDSWNFLTTQQKEALKAVKHSDVSSLDYNGDAEYSKKFFNEQNINFYTKSEADDIAKQVQNNLTSEASQAYAAMKLIKINNNQKVGGRILIQHNASHPARTTGYNGQKISNFPSENHDEEVENMTWRHAKGTAGSLNVANGTAADLTNARYVIDKLKELKDNSGRSLYDNSMILIFGDHSDHDRAKNYYQKIEAAKIQDNSELLIKFPNANNKTNYPKIDINHTIWAGDMNTIIKNYFENKPNNPMTIFDDKTFSLNRPILISDRNNWDTKFAFGSLNENNDFIWDGEVAQSDWQNNTIPPQAFNLFEKSVDEIYNKLFLK